MSVQWSHIPRLKFYFCSASSQNVVKPLAVPITMRTAEQVFIWLWLKSYLPRLHLTTPWRELSETVLRLLCMNVCNNTRGDYECLACKWSSFNFSKISFLIENLFIFELFSSALYRNYFLRFFLAQLQLGKTYWVPGMKWSLDGIH